MPLGSRPAACSLNPLNTRCHGIAICEAGTQLSHRIEVGELLRDYLQSCPARVVEDAGVRFQDTDDCDSDSGLEGVI